MHAHLEWAQMNFGSCQLGDQRRTDRLIRVAADVASNPSASFPDQMKTWGDLKAAYNLLNRDGVTFQAVARPHWELTKARTSGRYLLIGDTNEIDFGRHRDVPDLGPTGNGSGWGFLLHNALLVSTSSKEVVGVAGQAIHYRPQEKTKAQKKQHSAARLKRHRESEVWGEVIHQVGPPPENVEWIHVLDRGGDNFEVYCHLLQQRSGWVIRAARLNRKILAGPSKQWMELSQYLPQLKQLGSYELPLRARPQQPARTAKLQVFVGSLSMPVPHHKRPWVRELNPQPIPMNVVYVMEADPPTGVEPISWVLLTSLPVETFDEAWTVIEYYACRWLVEEYHKALKTGCRVEARQLKMAGRLEAMVGLMSVSPMGLDAVERAAEIAIRGNLMVRWPRHRELQETWR